MNDNAPPPPREPERAKYIRWLDRTFPVTEMTEPNEQVAATEPTAPTDTVVLWGSIGRWRLADETDNPAIFRLVEVGDPFSMSNRFAYVSRDVWERYQRAYQEYNTVADLLAHAPGVTGRARRIAAPS